MRYEYIDPFVSTTLRVLDAAIRGAIRQGEVTVLQGDRIYGDVSVVVKLVGDSEGNVILSMDTDTALRICSTMFGADVTAITPGDLDALAELGNMIAGNAVSALNDLGFDFSVEPPQVLVKAADAGARPDVEALQIPLTSDCGELTMNVVLGTN